MDVERTFAPEALSVPAVRRFVTGALNHLPGATLEAVRLMISELATNAVLYGATDYTVSLRHHRDRLTVSVTDRGRGTPRPHPGPDPSEPHGRGLLIVRELADDWGVTLHDGQGGKTVWFSLSLGVRQGSCV